MVKVDIARVLKTLDLAEKRLATLPKAAYEEFVKETPVRTGRARASTDLRGNTIVADYPYAQRLDEGYSRQAPQGMSEPVIKFIEEEVTKRLKGI